VQHTYVVNAIDEWIVATVTHRQPITAEPNYVDISVSAKKPN
jgi:hypothetical protein